MKLSPLLTLSFAILVISGYFVLVLATVEDDWEDIERANKFLILVTNSTVIDDKTTILMLNDFFFPPDLSDSNFSE
jgi:UDP-N-acetylmuramyl pentapeptide phosphotransferase/UDP-N-acetylglucosamine-1-phosphate transferase